MPYTAPIGLDQANSTQDVNFQSRSTTDSLQSFDKVFSEALSKDEAINLNTTTVDTGHDSKIVPDNTEFSSTKSQSFLTSKPCTAQFMAMTGCDYATAISALYQYENWETYINNEDVPSLKDAQEQLQLEIKNETRQGKAGSYGARSDYIAPIMPEPENPGTIVPAFNDVTRNIESVHFMGHDGTGYTNADFSDKEQITRHAIGFGLGRVSLDNFAKLLGGENKNWNSLDINEVKKSFQTQNFFLDKNRLQENWASTSG